MSQNQPVPFPDLRVTPDHRRWVLPVTAEVCVGPPDRRFLFGGMGLGASMLAMERSCGRPVIWATAQYLSFARMPAMLDIDVIVPIEGKYTSQARAIGHVGDREIVTVNAALGERPSALSLQGEMAPKVPPPEDCPRFASDLHLVGELHAALEMRVAKGRFGVFSSAPVSGDGHVLVWMRCHRRPVDAITLAIMADFVPSAAGNMLDMRAGGNSLDNTIRICRIVETEWVLCDIMIHGVHGGCGHGRMNLFAEDGTLMAMASQSFILRVY